MFYKFASGIFCHYPVCFQGGPNYCCHCVYKALEIPAVSPNDLNHWNVFKNPTNTQAGEVPRLLLGIAFVFQKLKVLLYEVSEF
jgi:hypothetical protein